MKKTGFIVFLFFLSACSSTKSPVVSREIISADQESERLGGRIITIVQDGDTWYGIAFANNLSVNDLAAWNGFTENDKLRMGQRLRLTKPLGYQQEPIGIAAAVNETVNTSSLTSNPVAPINSSSSVLTATQVVGEKTLDTAISSAKPSKNERIKVQSPLQFDQKNLRWSWPVQGRVITQFSPNLGRKGIDIAGRQNQAVKVAAPGRVVYQGNGIKGYRNLIIVKHSDSLLSAYAHNEQVYVQEGEWVSENQTISTVGLKQGKPLLHFEIRQNGKPVNPLQYLGS